MKIEGSVEEFEQFFNRFILLKKTEIKIDGTKVGEQFVPSKRIISHLGNHD